MWLFVAPTHQVKVEIPTATCKVTVMAQVTAAGTVTANVTVKCDVAAAGTIILGIGPY